MFSPRRIISLAAVFGMAAATAACGEDQPVPGQPLTFDITQAPVQPPEARNVPLKIIDADRSETPEALAKRLQTEGYTVTLMNGGDPTFTAVTDNKINTVILKTNIVVVKGQKQEVGEFGTVSYLIDVDYLNGMVDGGTWTIQSVAHPNGRGSSDGEMAIREDWANALLASYDFPSLKGQRQQVTRFGSAPQTMRADDTGSKCFTAPGTPSSDSTCASGILVSYKASYFRNTYLKNRQVCWQGVCSLDLKYRDNGTVAYLDRLRGSLKDLYLKQFGKIDPPKS